MLRAFTLLVLVLASEAHAQHLRPAKDSKKTTFAWIAAMHAAAAFDVWTTHRSLRQGAREANPLLRPVARTPWLHVGVHGSVAGANYMQIKRLKHRNIVAVSVVLLHVGLGIHNYRQARRAAAWNQAPFGAGR